MTFEQGAITVIGAVTGALVFVCKLLWEKAQQCEHDRYELREEVEKLNKSLGISEGELKGFKQCPDKTCPFKAAAAAGAVGVILLLGLSGCAAFDRSIGVSYETPAGDRFGLQLGAGRGYAK